MPASVPKPCTMLSTPAGSRSPISDQQHVDRRGRLLGRLEDTALPAASAGASFQMAISIGKFQGMICADDAERLMEVIGDGVLVELGEVALLGA